ncbi:TonB-dependent receptor [Hyphomicrobium sp.]|uniref:TonB-dependent receptor n=1 Tax=Hyphomicrobium sp. TaxID=82 RepID=UPI002E36D0CF|nr:TonB-dependent receptor [Hyphomicrobium sp.]HEX2843350.1 TonB-dependent receptor [Hyphomicrobium sp.]
MRRTLGLVFWTTAWVGTAAAQTQTELPAVVVTTPTAAKQAKASQPAPVKAGAVQQSSDEDSSSFAAVESIDPRAGSIGIAQSASQGYVSAEEIAAVPAYRTGDILEAVPGLVVTQHSGEGKANQYFVRGFNIDHGTDLAITVDGMPVNMRTHGHGQGYADTNFMIPEIMRGLTFRKGPYFASEGDFSSAGAVHLDIVDKLDKNFGRIEAGSFGHRRAVAGMSSPVGVDGTVLVAGEAHFFDGPWERPDDLRKFNGVMRYSNGSFNNGFAVTAMAYSGHWNATDQIPLRGVESGAIDRFGTLDPTDGGSSHRYSLSGRWNQTDANSATRVNAYVLKSDMSLFSNFTYFLNDPVNGDQFQQADDRWVAGASASKTFFGMLLPGVKSETTIGIQGRYDNIEVGLFNTKQREHLSTVREDRVEEASVGVFAESTLHWTNWLRTTTGLRADLYTADVMSNMPVNSGSDTDGIVSPKFGLVLGPWAATELYLNAGTGFHSNDARGTVTTVDPASGDPVSPAPFLVRSKGAEVGLRTQPNSGLTSTASVFILDFDSEIVFVGDAGTTEASRPSRRIGAEYTLHAQLLPWLTLDLDAAYTHARFQEDDPAAPGRHIPGAIEGVVAAGLSFDNLDGWFGNVNIRYFGARPLIEDDSVRSESSTPVSASLGYRFDDGFIVRLDGFNLFDQTSSQIDYYYASRLPGEPAGGVEDIHFHPLEPRSFRLSLTKEW